MFSTRQWVQCKRVWFTASAACEGPWSHRIEYEYEYDYEYEHEHEHEHEYDYDYNYNYNYNYEYEYEYEHEHEQGESLGWVVRAMPAPALHSAKKQRETFIPRCFELNFEEINAPAE